MTRTFVVYFSEGQLAVLRAEHKRLAKDWAVRSSFVTNPETVAAGDRRLRVLEAALEMLGEKVGE